MIKKVIHVSIIVILTVFFSNGSYAIRKGDETEKEVSQKIKNTEQWMATYYQHKEPSKVINAIRIFANNDMLSHGPSQSIILAFFIQVFAHNPKEVSTWMQQLDDLNESDKKTLLLALWQSNSEQADQYIKQLSLKNNNTLSLFAKELLKKPKINLLTEDLTTPAGLDMLWGSFYGSGNPKFIEKIIQMSAWTEDISNGATPEMMDKLTTVSAARWSLTRNALRDPRIEDIINTEYESTTDPDLKSLLIQIMEAVKLQQRKGQG